MQFPVTMNPKERRTLKMKENRYVLILDIFSRRNYDGIILIFIDENQAQELMQEFHEGICGGHFSPTGTAHNIIRDGFYWPSIFRDSYATIMKCVSCRGLSSHNWSQLLIPFPTSYFSSPFYFHNLFFPFIFPLLYLPEFPFSFLPSFLPFLVTILSRFSF
jgi:hypothetical protein